MAFRSILGNSFKSEIKKIRHPEYIGRIQDECGKIRIDPLSETEPLTGNFSLYGFRYRKIKDTNPEYRILIVTADCKFYLDDNQVGCEHELCPVGLDETYNEHINGDLLNNEKWLGFPVDTEPDLNASCNGIIKFSLFGPRELFNNLYKSPKKILEQYARI